MLALSPRMRRRELWPVHLFVATHLLSMGLTMPWNYGYRLIMPPFAYTSTLAASASAAMLLDRWRRGGSTRVVGAGA